MKCLKCGAELENGVLFCRDCGAKVELRSKKYCRECGTELADGAKFCFNCGAKTDLSDFAAEKPSGEPVLWNNNEPSALDTDAENSTASGVKHEIESVRNMLSEEVGKVKDKVTDAVGPVKKPDKKLVIIALSVLLLIILSFKGCGSSGSTRKAAESDNLIPMIDVIGLTYPEAVEALENAGFTDIYADTDSSVSEDQWIVSDQNVPSGDRIAADRKIRLTCVKSCMLYLDISSELNLFLSTYTISVYLDGKDIGSVDNGETFTYMADVYTGEHIIGFEKSGSSSPSCSKKITVSGDTTYSCTLSHSSSEIGITNERLDSNLDGASLIVIDVKGMVLSEAASKLSRLGFSNVEEDAGGKLIWNKDNWIVLDQGLEPGSVVDKNELFWLDCISLDDYFSDTYVGRTISDIQVLAKEAGFSVIFEDDNNSNIDMTSLTDQEKSFYIADAARRYGGADKTAVVTLRHTSDAQQNQIAIPETGTEDDAQVTVTAPLPVEAEDVIDDKPAVTSGTGMPVMPGSNVDTAIEAAKAYGLSRAFSDMDMGHGTMMCALSNDSGGLTLDIIYSTETKGILCANIVTFNVMSSAGEQTSFISGMAGVLCPSADSAEVAQWVSANVGGSKKTTINGFVYEVSLGPAGNAVYNAGVENWENWDMSLY